MKTLEVGDRFIDVRKGINNRIIEIVDIEYEDFEGLYSEKIPIYLYRKLGRNSIIRPTTGMAGFEHGSPFHQQLIPATKLTKLLYDAR